MFSWFFIDRPIFATVVSLTIFALGAIAFVRLPVAQFPDVTPPVVNVRATFPGADAETVAESIAVPIEREVNGVGGSIYMSSTCGADGTYSLNVFFEVGTDPNMATVFVQNRVALAEPSLPEEVRRLGVVVKKKSTNLLALCSLREKERRDEAGRALPPTRDDLYLSNYATIFIEERLSRVPGVGDASPMDERDFGMRVWLDPNLLALRNVSVQEVLRALQAQNTQVAAGSLGAEPVPRGQVETLNISTRGRLETPEEFGETAIRTDADGRVLKLRDVARVELGKYDYSRFSRFDGYPSATLAIYQTPGANALTTMNRVRAELDAMKAELDENGLELVVGYDSTRFVKAAVDEVEETLIFAVLIVVGVVYFFLQDWRAALIPATTLPVSLVGCFGPMAALGFSLNSLTLFGLVLAVGIVVDDAIVVVENTNRVLAENPNLTAREAAKRSIKQVFGPIVATTCVVVAVFLPTTFVSGTTGRMYSQFALTIACSTVLSSICALTLSPALCALFLKSGGSGSVAGGFVDSADAINSIASKERRENEKNGGKENAALSANGARGAGGERRKEDGWANWKNWAKFWLLGGWARFIVLGLFNATFGTFAALYERALRFATRFPIFGTIFWGATIAAFLIGVRTLPTGFLPNEDQGVLFVDVRLPDGASAERTDATLGEIERILREIPAGEGTIAVGGYSMIEGVAAPNLALAVLTLKDWKERGSEESAETLKARLTAELARRVPEARTLVFSPPPIQGVGTSGGLEFELLDRREVGSVALWEAGQTLTAKASESGDFLTVASSFNPASPKYFLDVDREKAKRMGVDLDELFATLRTLLGSTYVNDFNRFGRVFRVVAQADGAFRRNEEEALDLPVVAADGETLPLKSVATLKKTTAPRYLSRFNMSPAIFMTGVLAPGVATGEGMRTLETLERRLPIGFAVDWVGASYQEKETGSVVYWIFAAATLFGFLALAAQYESWSAPLIVMTAVPLGVSGALGAVALAGLDVNLFTQIGLTLMVALSAKNAILIVEFARELRLKEGRGIVDAARIAGKTRLRPIATTSLAFILGVVPLAVATGAGAASRRAIGTAVCGGMLTETFVGILITPVLFVVLTRIAEGTSRLWRRNGDGDAAI
ncbi:MAG: efflux RND transporter permease subunit [Thermoguttaceae bacterium]|nr:efflux RND transporter permease subunit [Thermoguttaceae bacterium]